MSRDAIEACEVCVLGGGPSGSVIARRLAGLGHDTVLLERGHGGGVHAESLAPSILPLLDSLGLRDHIGAAVFRRETSALLLWGQQVVEEKRFETGPSLLVARPRLDEVLREAAIRAGARLIAPAASRAARRPAAGEWLIPVSGPTGTEAIRARFLVDARGRRRGWSATGAPLAAISANWESRDGSFSETRIEAGSNCWIWGSPLPDGGYAATVFLDPKRIAGLGGPRRAAFYRECVSASRLLGKLRYGTMTGPVRVRDATSGVGHRLIGENFIRVGEAAVALDPLASQGVQRAILSAVQGAAAVHTLLLPGGDHEAAVEFYGGRQQHAAVQAQSHAARLYAIGGGERAGPFWTSRCRLPDRASAGPAVSVPNRAALPARLCLSPELRVVRVPVLTGALIERGWALDHPAFAEPVAYFGGVALAPLIAGLGTASTQEIIGRWSRQMQPATAHGLAAWMCAVGILVDPAGAPSQSPD